MVNISRVYELRLKRIAKMSNPKNLAEHITSKVINHLDNQNKELSNLHKELQFYRTFYKNNTCGHCGNLIPRETYRYICTCNEIACRDCEQSIRDDENYIDIKQCAFIKHTHACENCGVKNSVIDPCKCKDDVPYNRKIWKF